MFESKGVCEFSVCRNLKWRLPKELFALHSLGSPYLHFPQLKDFLCMINERALVYGDFDRCGVCGRLRNSTPPQRYSHQIPGTCDCYFKWQKMWLSILIKLRGISWYIQMGFKCNHMYPYKSKTEGTWREGHTHRRWCEDKAERRCSHTPQAELLASCTEFLPSESTLIKELLE